ncbi:MAG: bifunctional adenosylcobinamide kinase/adenosylcobinamide-phosphate guanylyltransferase [Synergistaceae bacterium]|nr:bifunctional adenosylcobinamide kinase/adenosylcobinamide-phosphate guanylyltransferase [Synergistaceae bacterium]
MLILIAGGARSGKSSYAESRLSELSGYPKIYMAVSKIYDDEMRERVKIHQAMRKGKGFLTLERTQDLGNAEIPFGSDIMIESLTVWAANEMFTDEGVNASDSVVSKILLDLGKLLLRAGNVVIVTDDIFSDGGGFDELTEGYVKCLAELTVKIAEISGEVWECYSGINICYKTKENNL